MDVKHLFIMNGRKENRKIKTEQEKGGVFLKD